MTRWKTLPAHLHVASVALLSKPGARLAFLTLVAVLACWAQDPFSSLGASAQTISTGTFVTGLVEFAIVIAGLLLASVITACMFRATTPLPQVSQQEEMGHPIRIN